MNLDRQPNHALRPTRMFVTFSQEVDSKVVHEDDDRGDCGAAKIKRGKRCNRDSGKG